jgi:hypothetical protein
MFERAVIGVQMSENLHPYVVFLPSDQKSKILSGIFGSKATVDILRFALSQGILNEIYQKDLVKKLAYSNKTVIGNLKSLTKLGVLSEDMKKIEKDGRVVWIKAYQLSDVGRWFALLIAEEKDLTEKEKAEILQDIFRTYIRWVKDFSKKLGISKKALKEVFMQEMKQR